MDRKTKSFIQGIVHSLLWLLGILAVLKLTQHSEARVAYGYLTGWWASLYFGYIGRIKITAAISAFTIYLCAGILAIYLDWPWFYKGLPESVTPQYILVLIIGGAIFVSPIMINSIVRLIMKRKE